MWQKMNAVFALAVLVLLFSVSGVFAGEPWFAPGMYPGMYACAVNADAMIPDEYHQEWDTDLDHKTVYSNFVRYYDTESFESPDNDGDFSFAFYLDYEAVQVQMTYSGDQQASPTNGYWYYTDQEQWNVTLDFQEDGSTWYMAGCWANIFKTELPYPYPSSAGYWIGWWWGETEELHVVYGSVGAKMID